MSEIVDNTVTKVGVKYVTGDVTLSVGFTSGEGKDSATWVLLVLQKMLKTLLKLVFLMLLLQV